MKSVYAMTIAVLLWAGLPSDVARGQTPLERVSQHIGDSTLVFGQINLKELDVRPMLDIARRLNARDMPELGARLEQELDVLLRRGFTDAFVLVDLDEIARGPILLMPVPAGQDAKLAARDLQSSLEAIVGDKLHSPGVCQPLGEFIVLAHEESYRRLSLRKDVSQRPDLLASIKSVDPAGIVLIAQPTPDMRRVLRELLPSVVAPGLTAGDLLSGVHSATFSLATQGGLRARLVIQSQDNAAARRLNDWRTKLTQEKLGSDPQLLAVLDDLQVELQGDRLEFQLSPDRASAVVDGLVSPMRRRAREAQNMNNLKQIALAFFNFEATYGSFPPAASFDGNNQPLLSWRVYVLPFVEQEALYKRFHLDEPWDSPHNRTLIAEMPAVFRSPNAQTEPGKTTYLVPVGEMTAFSQPVGTRLAEITDGTSNTIMIVEVAAEQAVTWTQPQDWQVDMEQPYRGLLGNRDAFAVALCDGSVRKLPKTLSDETIRRLIGKADGKPVEW